MITISRQIQDLEPNSWYSFRRDDTNMVFDLMKAYGVDEENSYLFNAVNADYFIPKWNRPSAPFIVVDEDYLTNQLADSEFLLETDSAVMCGRNKSRMAGMLYREHSDNVETLDDVLSKIDSDERREYLFQFRASSKALRKNYLVLPYEGDEAFVPVVYDTKSPGDSFPVNRQYSNTKGTYEIWSAEFNPALLPNDGFGNPQDIRELTFKLINPVTGATVGGSSKTYMFMRTGEVNSLNSELVPDIFNNPDIYEQPEYAPGRPGKFEFVDIYFLYRGNYYKLKENENMQLWIPKVEMIYFLVKTPHLFDTRSYDLEETITTVQTEDLFMEYLGYRFYYNNTRNVIRLYDVQTQKFISPEFPAAVDDTKLFYIKTKYEKLALHNPSTGYFNYNLVLTLSTVGGSSYELKREYKGGVMDIMYKGVTKVQSIRSFDSYPHLIGNMPQTKYDIQKDISLTKTIDVKYDSNTTKSVVVPQKIFYGSAYSIMAVDNFCYFINRDILNDIERLYYTQYREDNSILDRSLIQYWPLDNLRSNDLRTSLNTKNTAEESLNLYGYMNFKGSGNVLIEEEKEFHSVIKKSTYFDGNIMGNSNTYNTWSNSANYTINLWFKSTQKTKGVILCDMDKETVSTAGIYIGVSEGGFLEISFNTRTSQIFQRNITDGEWHMITVVCTSTSSYLLYVDGTFITSIQRTTATVNKINQTNYQTYFMGHPLGKHTEGNLARVGFYGTRIGANRIFEMFQGDVEHRIYGTILASNMPFATEVRFFNHRTGEYINSAYSDVETGKFVYRNYDGVSVHLLVVNNNHKYGTIQVMGPLSPASVPN